MKKEIRDLIGDVVRGYGEHDVLTFASAIAFQLFFATIPMLLFGLGLLGGVGLTEAWSRDVAPELRESVSPPAFQVIDDTVRRVLEERQVFWMTAGALLAVYELSGGMRAVMQVFDRIYRVPPERRRPRLRRMAVSIGLGIGVAVFTLAAAATVILAPRVLGDGALGGVAGVLRWPVAVVLLGAMVAMLVRHGPSTPQRGSRVTLGTVLCVAAWLATSLVFGWYLKSVADYGSIFGALATIFVTLSYLYLASAAFLTGAEVDARVRARLDGESEGAGSGYGGRHVVAGRRALSDLSALLPGQRR